MTPLLIFNKLASCSGLIIISSLQAPSSPLPFECHTLSRCKGFTTDHTSQAFFRFLLILADYSSFPPSLPKFWHLDPMLDQTELKTRQQVWTTDRVCLNTSVDVWVSHVNGLYNWLCVWVSAELPRNTTCGPLSETKSDFCGQVGFLKQVYQALKECLHTTATAPTGRLSSPPLNRFSFCIFSLRLCVCTRSNWLFEMDALQWVVQTADDSCLCYTGS